MTLDNILNEVASQLDIPQDVCKEAYYASWRFIREKAKALPLYTDRNMSEEDYGKMQTSFNIPSLGKLACPYERYVNVNKRWQVMQEYKKKIQNENKNKENVQD